MQQLEAFAVDTLAPVGFWDVTEAEYFADRKRVSNSMLKTFSASVPRFYQTYVTGEIQPDGDSDALRLGRALHLMILEPMKGLDTIVRAPKCDRRTGEGKRIWAEFVANSNGKLIVTQDEYDQLTGMRDGVLFNPTTRRLVEEEGVRELAVEWIDDGTGLACKARMDLVTEDLIIDLKTISSLSAWSKNVLDYGYHRQEAFYRSGDRHIARHFGRDSNREFVFVVVEKDPPYESAAFRLDEDSVALGHELNCNALAELAECVRTNRWISRYRGKVIETRLPEWALRKGA